MFGDTFLPVKGEEGGRCWSCGAEMWVAFFFEVGVGVGGGGAAVSCQKKEAAMNVLASKGAR